METQPTPIVIVGASTRQDEVDLTIALWRQARWRLYKSQRALVIQIMHGNPRDSPHRQADVGSESYPTLEPFEKGCRSGPVFAKG